MQEEATAIGHKNTKLATEDCTGSEQ